MINPFDLKGKRVLVTGATSGIGKEVAVSFAKQGATVFLIGRNPSKLDETLKQLTGIGHGSFIVDFLNLEIDFEGLIEAVRRFGQLDGIIHCAGVTSTLPINAINENKINEILRVNTVMPLLLTKNLLKKGLFNEDGGSIVFISSVMSEVGEIAKTLYSASKGALNAMVKSLSLELARRKIRVNSISPGVIMTPMVESGVYAKDPENLKRVESLHPLGFGSPSDISNGCIYLISNASKWVTGTNLIIDGGYLSH